MGAMVRHETRTMSIAPYPVFQKLKLNNQNLILISSQYRGIINQNGDLMMQIKDLKLLFDAGSLKKAVVCQSPMGKGYLLMCDKHVMQAQRGGERVFKTIDAAVESASKVGFASVEVQL
ncbi:hypothetical protein [Vibrio nigripulchritudo]|uniref:hypothetical protein n=1 Tax=Vibrio nigripulchritudo TaxID=28173 RepID=UPI0024939A99|nr:hypothetical protein [Vibrio nigripulchritudo]